MKHSIREKITYLTFLPAFGFLVLIACSEVKEIDPDEGIGAPCDDGFQCEDWLLCSEEGECYDPCPALGCAERRVGYCQDDGHSYIDALETCVINEEKTDASCELTNSYDIDCEGPPPDRCEGTTLITQEGDRCMNREGLVPTCIASEEVTVSCEDKEPQDRCTLNNTAVETVGFTGQCQVDEDTGRGECIAQAISAPLPCLNPPSDTCTEDGRSIILYETEGTCEQGEDGQDDECVYRAQTVACPEGETTRCIDMEGFIQAVTFSGQCVEDQIDGSSCEIIDTQPVERCPSEDESACNTLDNLQGTSFNLGVCTNQ